MSQLQIPYVDLKSQYQAIREDVNARIQKVLDHGAYVNGPEVVECEKVLAEYTGSKHALAVASGTDALLIPMMALGIKPGDEVITSPFSFIATAETIVLAGATPVYVDIDPITFNLDVSKIEKAITPKTKAIVPVSLYGQTPDMDEINALAKKHGLWVIEDAAQSFGATYKGKKSCNLSLAGGTSFFPSKPLGCYGDGGAIFTNDDQLALAMKEIREHGSEKRYYHTRLGINGRLDTLQCAIVISKMKRFPWEVEQRDRVAQRYNQAFAEISKPGFQYPRVASNRTSVWAQYTLMVPQREEFQKKLQARGVPTSVHYPLIMPDQPWYQKHAGSPAGDWTYSRKAAQQVVSLPLFPDMTAEQQNHVIEVVRESL